MLSKAAIGNSPKEQEDLDAYTNRVTAILQPYGLSSGFKLNPISIH